MELDHAKTVSAMCRYALGPWDMFKACAHREWILMRRHSFTYLFRRCPAPCPHSPPGPQESMHWLIHVAPADSHTASHVR